MSLLELEEVVKDFGRFKLHVSGTFDGITAILGPSGSGKTTMLNIIAGFLKHDSGRIVLKGRDISHYPPEKRRIGYVFQDYALFPHMTVRENLTYGGGDYKDVAETVEIDHLLDRHINQLSGGEKQRVALARALVSEPDILLLDEPMSNVDELMRKRLVIEMNSILREFGIPVIYVTHSRREALLIADRIGVMVGGRILQLDRAERVFEEPANRKVAEFMGAENIYGGTVLKSDGELLIEWSEGVVRSQRAGFKSGDEVVFCIRPEYVMIVREEKPLGDLLQGNVYEGKIVRRINVGGMFELVVKLQKEIVTALIPDHAYHRLKLDSREHVRIGFKKNRVHVMPKF